MNSNALVNDRLDCGAALIEALRRSGVLIVAAFWAKLAEESDWNLYLVTPAVEDDEQETNWYRNLQSVLGQRPELGIDLFDVIFIDTDNSMAIAAAEVIKSKSATGPFAVANPKPYPGMTRYGGKVFGGLEIDGAYIYPPPRAAVTA